MPIPPLLGLQVRATMPGLYCLGSWDQTQVPMLVGQAFYLLSRSLGTCSLICRGQLQTGQAKKSTVHAHNGGSSRTLAMPPAPVQSVLCVLFCFFYLKGLTGETCTYRDGLSDKGIEVHGGQSHTRCQDLHTGPGLVPTVLGVLSQPQPTGPN